MSITFIATSQLPTRHGHFLIHAFEESDTKQEHIALSMGNIADGQPVLARVHSELPCHRKSSYHITIKVSLRQG